MNSIAWILFGAYTLIILNNNKLGHRLSNLSVEQFA